MPLGIYDSLHYMGSRSHLHKYEAHSVSRGNTMKDVYTVQWWWSNLTESNIEDSVVAISNNRRLVR